MMDQTPLAAPTSANPSADQVGRLSALLEITRLLVAQISLDDLLQLIVAKTSELLDAERSTVYIVDHERGELWSKVAQMAAEIRLAIDGPGLATYVARTGEVVNIPDCYNDARFNPEVDRRTGFRTRNMLVMPMLSHQQEVIGVFQVMNRRGGAFGPDDEALLSSLAASAAIAVENAQLYAEQKRFFDSMVQALAASIDAKDRQTAGHSHRVTAYAMILAGGMGLSPQDVEKIRLAALLHDYGKIAIADAILTKPGKLTTEEYAAMREHARYTRQILSMVRFPRGMEQIPLMAAQHHERVDGKGGPEGLAGDAITLGGRIIAVADVFEALSARRYYKDPMPLEQVVRIIDEGRGAHFDAEVVDAMHRCLPAMQAQLEAFLAEDPAAGATPVAAT
ncbi:MAG: GAF domain-containing protein [Chloroflexi bacterium]|nr:GAF domain-containing protein [Chloroflexota bacterium]